MRDLGAREEQGRSWRGGKQPPADLSCGSGVSAPSGPQVTSGGVWEPPGWSEGQSQPPGLVNRHGAGASWVSGPLLSAWRHVPRALRLPQPAIGGREQGPPKLCASLGRAPSLPTARHPHGRSLCCGRRWHLVAPFPLSESSAQEGLDPCHPASPWALARCHLTPPSINSSFAILPLHPLGSRPALGQIPVSSVASLEGPLTVLLPRPLPLYSLQGGSCLPSTLALEVG